MSKLKKYVKWFDLCAAALALIAVILMFAPAIAYTGSGDPSITTFNGFQTIFGFSKTTNTALGDVTNHYLTFSFGNLLTLIFVVAAIVLLVLNNFGKGFKFLNLVAAGLLLVAGVFFFLTHAFTVPYSEQTALGTAYGIDKANWGLGVGAILSGVFAILGAGVSGCKLLIK